MLRFLKPGLSAQYLQLNAIAVRAKLQLHSIFYLLYFSLYSNLYQVKEVPFLSDIEILAFSGYLYHCPSAQQVLHRSWGTGWGALI